LARSFGECRGLSREQLEDIYQETVLALLRRPYESEEHLRSALRWGIKHRALYLHRDERRRGEILAHRAPEFQLAAQARVEEQVPELAALLAHDRVIVSEFLTELSGLEQRVFLLIAEGMRYRAIAPMLQVSVNDARKASRVCERKRERFQLLYDTGRLCGFRSETIRALQAGQETSEELAQRAFAHLEGCAHCRAEHKTNARRLRRTFQGQAAALLPIPLLAGRLGWLARLDLRARALQQRLAGHAVPPGGGGVRERAVALLAGSGAAAKVAAGVATVAVIAGGTIGATRVLDQPRTRHHADAQLALGAPAPRTPRIVQRQALATVAAPAKHGGPSRPARGSSRRAAPPTPAVNTGGQREPGGFAYLGVPSGTPPPAGEATARTAATHGGGPFSP